MLGNEFEEQGEEKLLSRIDVMTMVRKAGRNVKVDLSGQNLQGVDLSNLSLIFINFVGADLRDSNLGGADLRGANLEGADLRGAILDGANLEGADFKNAILTPVQQKYLKDLGLLEAEHELTGPEKLTQPADIEAAEPVSYHQSEPAPVYRPQALPAVPEPLPARDSERSPKEDGLVLRISQNGLTTRNLGRIFEVLTRLYTKARLVFYGQFNDLINYALHGDPQYEAASGLALTRFSLAAPVEIEVTPYSKENGQDSRFSTDSGETVILAALREAVARLADLNQNRPIGANAATDPEPGPQYHEITLRLVNRLYPGAGPDLREIIVQALLPEIQKLA